MRTLSNNAGGASRRIPGAASVAGMHDRRAGSTILRLLIVASLLVHTACENEPNLPALEYEVDDVEVVVSTESELIGRPAELLVGWNGNLFVLDDQMARVLEFSPSGESLRTFGGEGGGPG